MPKSGFSPYPTNSPSADLTFAPTTIADSISAAPSSGRAQGDFRRNAQTLRRLRPQRKRRQPKPPPSSSPAGLLLHLVRRLARRFLAALPVLVRPLRAPGVEILVEFRLVLLAVVFVIAVELADLLVAPGTIMVVMHVAAAIAHPVLVA